VPPGVGFALCESPHARCESSRHPRAYIAKITRSTLGKGLHGKDPSQCAWGRSPMEHHALNNIRADTGSPDRAQGLLEVQEHPFCTHSINLESDQCMEW
jgi:hypothetical protein